LIQLVFGVIDVDFDIVRVTHLSNALKHFIRDHQIFGEIVVDRCLNQDILVSLFQDINVKLRNIKQMQDFREPNFTLDAFDVDVIKIVYREIQIRIWVFRKPRICKHHVLLCERGVYQVDQVVDIELVYAFVLGKLDGSVCLEWHHS
jgi:hypothetical protein